MITIKVAEPQQIELADGYENILFARGYLLTKEPSPLPVAHWARLDFGGMHLAYDPRVGISTAESESGAVALLGHAIHVREDTSDLRVIVARLHDALAVSRQSFLNELDKLSGRYVVLDSGREGTWIQSDAVALRSVFWDESNRAVSSHQNLLGEIGGLAPSIFGSKTWKRANKSFSYPGNKSHWDGVKFLSANHQLNLETFQASRIPMEAPEPTGLAEVADDTLQMMRVQLKHLLEYESPLVSLTAGQDSRTTLAALRPNKNDFQYFTYALNYSRRLRAVKMDANDSVRIAQDMGLERHSLMNIEGPLQDVLLNDVMQRNSPRSSNRNVAAMYLTEFPQAQMHIRSSFNEVGIAAYRTKYAPSEVTPEVLSDILTYGTGYSQDTVAATAEYMDESGILNVAGYDPLDLYYWEVRMGSWLGNISHESDIAFDTHILINSREMVRTILSAPVAERAIGNVYHRLIEIAWPELYKIPVNSVMQKFPDPQ